MKNIFAILIALIIAACATYGKEFDHEMLQQLQPGVSTVADVIKMIGTKPMTTTYMEDGTVQRLWAYSSVVMTRHKNRSAILSFDKNGVFQRIISVSEMEI